MTGLTVPRFADVHPGPDSKYVWLIARKCCFTAISGEMQAGRTFEELASG
jgi:hypothetical protein